MQHITDAVVDATLTATEAQIVLEDAFARFGRGEAAMQTRVRTEVSGVKLSTLGALIPGQKVVGAKVYTTIKGQFNFVILLFSSEDGRALASFDAAAITRLRTAACSVIAARHLARTDSEVLALYGAGVQGRMHAIQMAGAYPLREIRVSDPNASATLVNELQAQCSVPVRMTTPEETIKNADIIVTASRSSVPLFGGEQLAPGTFIAAIGSSLPNTRELDDETLGRASCIAVEWKYQTLQEAGDLVLAGSGVLKADRLVELGELINGAQPGRRNSEEITIYKSVGVGLEDVALAGLVWQRLGQRSTT